MIPPIYDLLSGSPAVVAIVDDRIGSHGRVLPNETRPYITWQTVGGSPENQLPGGRALIDRARVQIDCWHQTEPGLRALVEAARIAVESQCYVVGIVADERDSATGLFRFSFDVEIFFE